jgi:glycosyltransferase involved in cell wall biosynthesis
MKQRVHEIDNQVQVNVMPSGFNEDLFFPIKKEIAREKLGLPSSGPIILNISSLDDNKNVELFINGIAQILSRYPNLQAFIIGDGRKHKPLQKLIIQLNLEAHVKLLGALPHDAINLWINASDFVTLCSYSEGSPTVMYETLACGKPFLGSTVGGIPEVINSDEYGRLFDPYDIDDFIRKMQIMLEGNWDSQKIIVYSTQFSQTSLSQKILKVYEKLLSTE